MAQTPQKTRYKSLSIFTVLILLFSFAYYYFIHVSNKKQTFDEKAFRIIENVSHNIESKYKNNSKIVKNAHADIVKKLIAIEEKDEKLINTPGQLKREFASKRVPDLITVRSVNINARDAAISAKFEIVSSTTLDKDTVVIKSNASPESDPSLTIESEVSYKFDSLFTSVLPKEFFKRYIIFSKSRVYYSDIAYDKFSKVDLDSLFFNDKKRGIENIFHSSDIAEVEFNDETQLLYITPINVADKTSIFIAGIIQKSHYNQQAFQIETNTLTTLLILLVILILSIPFIKILMMSNDERMHSSDAVTSFLAIILGSSFVILGLLNYFTHKGPTTQDNEEYLDKYANSIEKNFIGELDSILTQIDTVEKKMPEMDTSESRFPYDIAKVKEKGLYCKIYPHLNSINWVNRNGDQVAKWSTKNITPRVNLIFRPYFSIPNDTTQILWTHDSLKSFGEFYVESILSVTTGKSYAVVSKVSKIPKLSRWTTELWERRMKDLKYDPKPSVATLITNFKSLENLPIPSNITYMVIDQEGKVLFHKNRSKILQENVIEEMNNNFSLTNAIYGRNKKIFQSNYDELPYRVLVKPIGDMPIYLLVLMDESVQKINDAQILSLSAILYLLMFIIFAFQIGFFTIIDKEFTSKTKVKRLIFRTIWPNPTKTSRYLFLNIYIVVSLLIYVIGDMYNNVILTYSFFSLLITVNLLILRRFKNFRSIYSSIKYSIYFLTVLFIGFSLAFSSQIKSLELVLFILFIILSVVAVYKSFEIKKSKKPSYFKLIFNFWMFLFVIGLSVGPAFSFFSRAYNYEKLIYVQDVQYGLANYIVKNGFLNKDSDYQDYVSLNNYFTIDTIVSPDRNHGDKPDFENEKKFLKNIRFNLRGNSKKVSAFQFDNTDVNTVSWKNEGDSTTTLYYQYFNSKNDISDTIKAYSFFTINSKQIHLYPKEIMAIGINSFNGKVYVVIFGALIFALGLFYFIFYYSKTIFLLGMIPSRKNKVAEMIHASKNLYIISPPYVGITHFLKSELKEDNCQFIDTRFSAVNYTEKSDHIIDIEIDSTKKVIVIFDNGKKEPEELKKKFLLVGQIKKESYQKDSKIEKVIFVSQITPQQIVSYYRQEFNSAEDKAIVANFFDVLGDFITTYFPMRQYEGFNSEALEPQKNEEKVDTLKIGNSEYWMEISNGNTDKEDSLLNMQNKDQLYFYALWTSLEKREKFLLYDLAQDGLVNYRNLDIIYNLLNREYIHYRAGRLQLFGNEFANFILTIIDKEEALELEKELIQSGRWAGLRLPLFTIIGGILVFIFLTQQEVLNQVLGWATAALALIPILSRLMIGLPFLTKGSKAKTVN